jgi:hypothetical protein
VGTVEEVNEREDLELAQFELDVQAIKDYLGNSEEINEFSYFLVKIENGDYTEIYGIEGFPYLCKSVFRIIFQVGDILAL